MLRALDLTNFRCFQKHTILLRSQTVIIGRNNAGKSTLVDALRLVSIVSSRFRNLIFRKPPSWSDLRRNAYGVSPSLEGIDVDLTNIFTNYDDPPAVVKATFASGSAIEVYVGPESMLHAIIFDKTGALVTSRSAAFGASGPDSAS